MWDSLRPETNNLEEVKWEKQQIQVELQISKSEWYGKMSEFGHDDTSVEVFIAFSLDAQTQAHPDYHSKNL